MLKRWRRASASASASASARARGFTLVELLVAMTVLVIGTTLAAPGITSMIASRRVQALGQSLLDGIHTARFEAIRRNTAVRFSLRADGLGWTVTQVSSGATLRSAVDPAMASVLLTSSNGASSVDFLPNGMRQSGVQIDQLSLSSIQSSEPARRRINVFGGGMIRLCDPGILTANDPRRC